MAALDRMIELIATLSGEHPQQRLAESEARARSVHEAGGGNEASDRLAADLYLANTLIELATEGVLDRDGVLQAVQRLADAYEMPAETAAFLAVIRVAGSPRLHELPPVVAAEVPLKLLIGLGYARDVSVWRVTEDGVELFLRLGAEVGREEYAAALAAISGRRRKKPTEADRVCAVVRRFGSPYAAIVATTDMERSRLEPLLAQAASALTTTLEREQLLHRSNEREAVLVGSGEKRLMRLAFDLHDGPVQGVLTLAEDVRQLREQLLPLVAEEHQDKASGRFDDLLAHITEVDVQMRELAHSLESKSIISRPLGEILHREVEAFGNRYAIEARIEIRGDPESLSSTQRIAVFRAVQEALANIREHSGATAVDVLLRARRSAIELRISDNGHGFEVGRALALAAQRGRLGLVGMGERVRLLGGTFLIDSRSGGPTTLSLTLPRWEPLTAPVNRP